MKKLVPVILFFSVLVLVPLLTWLNLSKGLDYRLQNRQELVVKDSLDMKADTLGLFKHKTSIVVAKSYDRLADFETAVNEMFVKENRNVRLYAVGHFDDSIEALPESYFDEVWSRYSDKTFFLVDTAGYIRNMYEDNDKDVGKLLEHTAVIIPQKKRGSIEVKLNSNE